MILQAEVQAFQADGSVALHTRSNKYGKVLKLLPDLYLRSFCMVLKCCYNRGPVTDRLIRCSGSFVIQTLKLT